MAMLIREMIKQYHHVFIELSDQRTLSWPLLSSPMYLVALVAAYVYFVLNLGPRLMKDRPAFKLDRIIQVYNIIQVLLACYLLERGLTLGWGWNPVIPYRWFCEPVDFSNSDRAMEITRCMYLYFVIKIMDLLDTVFFVLRKNFRQITFLHVYHHGGMVIGSWIGSKYIPGGHGSLLGVVNSFVHAVMYSYYLLTSISPEQKKNIWWKKYITQLQMLQFLVVSLHNIPLIYTKNCGYPMWFALLVVPQNMFMLILFYDFYRKAYNKKKITSLTRESAESIDNDRKHTEVLNNGQNYVQDGKKID